MKYDVVLIGFPNKTIEIPPLGTSILQEVLLTTGYRSKQYDLNVMLKDELITEFNLELLLNEVLPFLFEINVNNKSVLDKLDSTASLLLDVKGSYGFAQLVHVKRLIQSRCYEDVFCDSSYSELYKKLMKLLSLSSFILNQIILSEHVEARFPELFLFKVVDEVLYKISEEKVPVVGVSIVELQRLFSLWAIKRLKDKFKYKGVVFVGGSDLTYFNEYVEHFDFIDFGIYKEGEVAILKLMACITKSEGKLYDIPNLLFMDNGKLIKNPIEDVGDFNSVIPNFDDLPLDRYISHALPIQAARGCSWGKCTYCKHFKTYGKDYYAGSMDSLVEQIKILKERYDTDLFHFVDDDFPLEIKNIFSEEIIKQGVDIKWLAYSRFDRRITKSMLELWYRSGLSVIEWGLETASDKVLKKVKKGVKLETAKRLLHDASDIGFLNKIFMFHNLPEEDIDELWKSVLFLKRYVEKGLVRPFWELLTPMELLVGTPLYEKNFNTLTPVDFKKVFKPRGKLVVQAGYIPFDNYEIKRSILSESLSGLKMLADKYNILEMDDEAILTDVILEDLRSKKYPIKIHSRIETAHRDYIRQREVA